MEFDFRRQMADLDDSQLMDVVSDLASYVPEARQAAQEEMMRRGLHAPDPADVVMAVQEPRAEQASSPAQPVWCRFLALLDRPAQFAVALCSFGAAWSDLRDWLVYWFIAGILSVVFMWSWNFLYSARPFSWCNSLLVYGWPILAGLAGGGTRRMREPPESTSWPYYLVIGLAALAVLVANSWLARQETIPDRTARDPGRAIVILAWIGFFVCGGALFQPVAETTLLAEPMPRMQMQMFALELLVVGMVCFSALRAGRPTAWWILTVLLGLGLCSTAFTWSALQPPGRIIMAGVFGTPFVILLGNHPWKWARVQTEAESHAPSASPE